MTNTNAANNNTNADAALDALIEARRATAIAWHAYNRHALTRVGDHQALADAVRAAARAEGEALAAYAAAETARA